MLQGFKDYGLIVDGGCPVLLVRLEKSTINKINSEVCRHFKFPALFLPCKTARWDDSPVVDAEADAEGFDAEEVERVGVVLGAVVDIAEWEFLDLFHVITTTKILPTRKSLFTIMLWN